MFEWMSNKSPRIKLVTVAVVACAIMLAAFGAMMTLGQQVYAQNNNQNNGNNNDNNNGNNNNGDNNNNDDDSPPPEPECGPDQFPVGGGCVDCEGPCPTVFYKPEHHQTM
jgi:hypothetical protein